MAWAVHREWDKASAKGIKCDLSKIAQTIAQYEPVRMLAPRGPAVREARREFSSCSNITVIESQADDFWMRDVMPTFAFCGEPGREKVVAIDWNFNGWGGTHERPPQRRIERDMLRFGIRKVIWLEGDPSEPITSGHTDGYVMCAPRGRVLIEKTRDEAVEPSFWREHDIATLENARDAAGKKLSVIKIFSPRRKFWNGDPESFAASYLNAYVANGVVIAARFGDAERDEVARKVLAKAFPGRKIITCELIILRTAVVVCIA